MNDSYFDPPDSFEIEIGYPSKNALCRYCEQPSEFRVKPSSWRNSKGIDLCNNHYEKISDNDEWAEVFFANPD